MCMLCLMYLTLFLLAQDLVPCVPILFKDEQIVLWRGILNQEQPSDL